MPKRKTAKHELTGKKIGRWHVLSKVINDGTHIKTRWLCKCECGTERIVLTQSLTDGRSISCGCLQKEVAGKIFGALGKTQKGNKSPQWRGGKTKNRGYIFILAHGHPRTTEISKYVQEHVLVMEKHLGRFLKKGETVHHKNGIRHDNRIENLELWTSSHRHGQRVIDMVEFAQNILSLYAPELLKNNIYKKQFLKDKMFYEKWLKSL